MAILKCKMCGGDIDVIEETTVMECEYCGSKQTIPKVDDEKLVKLYTRANRLRMNSEFDKAYSVYENIVAEFSEEAEAYWGLILCRYGIEYVDDLGTGDKIPTCHRSSLDSIMEDEDFEMVMEYADGISRRVYREQAKQLEEIRKGIIEVSGKEEPYDIFICYKETTENGERTIDSVMAQDVYSALTEKGYRVFFSRITLEDKLGQEYEPYIFAALNSAKIMLAFGTDYDYYNAVWVKNEWSRYLKLMAKDKEKHLIPCYKNIDAYDMPKEFARLQAQDMGKVGAIQDLLRGIDKIFGRREFQKKNESTNNEMINIDVVMSALNNQKESLLKRGYIAIEDGEFDKGDAFFDQVLNSDAECADAYWGKVLCAQKATNIDRVAYDIVRKITSSKIEKSEIILPEANVVNITREFDKINQHLKDLSDEELRELLSDLGQTIKYHSSIHSYRKVLDEINVETLGQYFRKRNYYERAFKYADERTLTEIGLLLSKVQSILQEDLDKEMIEEENAKKQMKQRDESIKKVIMERLSAVSEVYLQKNTENQEYVNQIHEQAEETNRIKTELENKIAKLRVEHDNIKGFFVQKKKKEIENNIRVLQQQLDSLNNSMNLRNTTICNSVDAFDLSTQIKCALSPKYKELMKEELVTKRLGGIEYENRTVISFGRYYYEKNGSEAPIKWRILEKNKNKILLITEEGIDSVRYHDEPVNISWEDCTLRKWLNNEFLRRAFNAEEQKRIMFNNIKSTRNDIRDKIFIFSISECEKYFSSASDRQIKPTPYTKSKKLMIGMTGKYGHVAWWLRSSEDGSREVATISATGDIKTKGVLANVGKVITVRPAMWIDVSDL